MSGRDEKGPLQRVNTLFPFTLWGKTYIVLIRWFTYYARLHRWLFPAQKPSSQCSKLNRTGICFMHWLFKLRKDKWKGMCTCFSLWIYHREPSTWLNLSYTPWCDDASLVRIIHEGSCSVCRIGSVLNLMVVRCVIAILSAGFTGADQLIPGGMFHWDVATEHLLQASSFFLSFVIADGTLSAFQTHLVVDFAEYCDDAVTSPWALPMVTTINPHSTWLARAKRTTRPPSSLAVDLNCETALLS